MSFGRNPHAAKAEAAEKKTEAARDASSYAQGWRDAARYWEKAADREKDAKRAAAYTERADAAWLAADEPRAEEPGEEA